MPYTGRTKRKFSNTSLGVFQEYQSRQAILVTCLFMIGYENTSLHAIDDFPMASPLCLVMDTCRWAIGRSRY